MWYKNHHFHHFYSLLEVKICIFPGPTGASKYPSDSQLIDQPSENLLFVTLENGKKKQQLVLGPILAHLAQIGPANFYHGQLSSCKRPEKTNDTILRKLSDSQTNRRTKRRE